MAFNPEIKNFIKNTTIFTVIFAVLIHFSWDFFASTSKDSAQAHNEATFENANITYIGNVATALSLRLGGMTPSKSQTSIGNGVVSISEVLSHPTKGQEKLIANNMLAITTYASVVNTDLLHMLESASNRSVALDNHISLLKSYYLQTQERLSIIIQQKEELRALLAQSDSGQQEAKGVLQKSYKEFQYTGVDEAIESYLQSKNLSFRAKIYMIYLERFERSYNALQNKNKKILDALINNREGIIKKSIVVIPDTGTDIIKELGLIQSEADYKAQKALN